MCIATLYVDFTVLLAHALHGNLLRSWGNLRPEKGWPWSFARGRTGQGSSCRQRSGCSMAGKSREGKIENKWLIWSG